MIVSCKLSAFDQVGAMGADERIGKDLQDTLILAIATLAQHSPQKRPHNMTPEIAARTADQYRANRVVIRVESHAIVRYIAVVLIQNR